MTGGESCNVRHTVCHLTAYRVEALESGVRRDVALYIIDDTTEFVETLRGLRIQIYVAAEIEKPHVFELFYHDGLAVCLPHESENLGMTVLSEYNNLCLWIGIVLFFMRLCNCNTTGHVASIISMLLRRAVS